MTPMLISKLKNSLSILFALLILSLLSCDNDNNISIFTQPIVLDRNGVQWTYEHLLDVPWDTLKPGDIVSIHYRAEPYREKILISESGTVAKPISIIGIPGPNGELPIIDGENADSNADEFPGSGVNYLGTRSLICIGNRRNSDGSQKWGTQPQNIVIKNLEIRNANRNFQYKTEGANPENYDDFVAAIWVDKISNFTLENCVIHHSGLGLFINSRDFDEPNHADISRNIVVRGNHFYENGFSGDQSMHNIYIEGINVLYEQNHIEPLTAGALGSTLKDRSSGTIVRYNWLEGTTRVLDLVEAEASASYTIHDPGYDKTYVYGNIIYNTLAYAPIHYGGDHYDYELYRKGILYFFGNTVVNEADQLTQTQGGNYSTLLFQLPSLQETAGLPIEEVVECHNNIIYNVSKTPGQPATDFYLMGNTGNLKLGKNWISPGYQLAGPNGQVISTVVQGQSNLLVGDSAGLNNPGFVDFNGKNFNLTVGSRSLNAGAPLAGPLQSSHPLTFQYVVHQKIKARAVVGAAADLGAFEKE